MRPIGAYRPNYGAFFIEDKFQLKDLTFRLGLRIDRYDLNQAVLRDPLIVEGFQSVGDVNYLYNVSNYANAADVPESERTYITHPGNIGSDYVLASRRERAGPLRRHHEGVGRVGHPGRRRWRRTGVFARSWSAACVNTAIEA